MTISEKLKICVQDIQNSYPLYFDVAYWNLAVENLTAKNFTAITQGQKFPLVLLLLTIPENKDYNSNFSVANVNIYLFTNTKQNYKIPERESETMPILRTIETDLIASFKRNGVRHGLIKSEEIFYDKTKKNKLESIVDAIYLNVTDFKYQFTNC